MVFRDHIGSDIEKIDIADIVSAERYRLRGVQDIDLRYRQTYSSGPTVSFPDLSISLCFFNGKNQFFASF